MSAFEPPLRYSEWAPAQAGLDPYVVCTWAAPAHSDDRVDDAEPVLPDGCMDVIWTGDRLFVAGPDTAPVPDVRPGRYAIGIRFRPGAAPPLLGPSATSLRNSRVDLADLVPGADELLDRLRVVDSVGAARSLLEASIVGRLGDAGAPDPVVAYAARTWRAEADHPLAATSATSATVARLAASAAVSERQLQRRFNAAVGYGPKYLYRVLRFQRFLARAGDPSLSLGELAYRTGYADQAHLTREAVEMSGRTPGQLRAARLPSPEVSETFKTGTPPQA